MCGCPVIESSKRHADGKVPRYDYTPDGKLARHTWARGIVTDYTYDNVGRLVSTTYSDDTPTVSLACNRAGRQVEAHDAAGVTTFAYDAFGANTNETVVGVAGTNVLERFYDTYGRSTGYAFNGVRQTTLAYDNQTLVKTATGIWSVTYNGENRPILWTQGTNAISMTFDRKGRRVTKNDKRFVYDGYLQIADNAGNAYVWDPTEPVATRPLAWQRGNSAAYYTHDGNKNVSEVVAIDNDIAAHYEYAPFGALILSRGASAEVNPFRFSSEYAEDDTATVYYNYRHYEPVMGRWASRDMIQEYGGAATPQNPRASAIGLKVIGEVFEMPPAA